MEVASGSIRFNTDSSKLEIYDGNAWFEIDIDHGSGRGLFMGGTPSPDTIDYITIDSTGDAIDFGNLTSGRFTGGAFASQTRALYVAGELAPGAESNIVDYVTISSLGDAIDFGDSIEARNGGDGGAASPTRICQAGGNNPSAINRIDFVNPQTTGDSVDFGDLTVARTYPFGTSNSHGGVS